MQQLWYEVEKTLYVGAYGSKTKQFVKESFQLLIQ